MRDFDVRHLARHRHQIIGQRTVGELTVVVIDAFFEERRAKTLHHTTTHLLVDQQRVDDAAAVFHHPVFQDLDEAGLDIDLDMGGLNAVGEGERKTLRRKVLRHGKLRLRARRQRIGTEIGDTGDLGEFDALAAAGGIDDPAGTYIEPVRLLLQDRPRQRDDVFLELARGAQRGFAADAGTTAGPHRTAMWRVFGVAGNHLDALAIDAEMFADDLSDDGLGALPQLGHRNGATHIARWRDGDHRPILRRNTCAADAIEGRAGIGNLDERRDADAAIDIAPAQLSLLCTQPVVIHQLAQPRQTGMVRQRLELVTGRRGARIGIVGDQIAAANLDRIEPGSSCRHIHQPLGHRERNRMTDGAILAHLHLVLKHHLQIGAIILEAIGSADQPEHLIALDHAGARIGRERPDGRDVIDIHGNDGAFTVERHARAHAMIAGMNVGDKRFDAVGDILHRAAEQHAEADRRHVLMIDVQLHTERAADIRRDDADVGFGNAEVPRVDVLKLIRRLRRVMRRQPHLVGIEIGDDGARLHRHCRMPAKMKLFLDDMRGAGKDSVDIAGVDLAVEADIVAQLRRNHRRAGRACRIDIDDGRKLLVLDQHRFGGVLGERPRIGDDRDHGLPGINYLVERQRQLRRRLHALEMIQRADPRLADFRQIGAGRNQADTRHFSRVLRVDPDDAGMGVRAADKRDMQHTRQHDIGDVAAAAGEQALGVRTRDGTADIGVGPIQRGESVAHAPTSATTFLLPAGAARLRATVSMASTMDS